MYNRANIQNEITMIDFLKVIADHPHVNRLYDYALANLTEHKSQNRNYICYGIDEHSLFRIEFRKVFSEGRLIGFRHAEICINPHSIFNDLKHNGNDFYIDDCIHTVGNVFKELGFSFDDMTDLEVVNIEYGLNLQLNREVQPLIDGIIYTKTAPFTTVKYDSFKRSKTTKFKEIKAYDKGVQFIDRPQYKINVNTFRFEVVSKQRKFIKKKLGVCNVTDLFREETYIKMFASILEEWNQVLIINTNRKHYKDSAEYWDRLLQRTKKNEDRNKWSIEKRKYYKSIKTNNLHQYISNLITEKCLQLRSREGSVKPRLIKVS